MKKVNDILACRALFFIMAFYVGLWTIRIPTIKHPNMLIKKVFKGKLKFEIFNFKINILRIEPIIPPAPTKNISFIYPFFRQNLGMRN